MFALPFSRSIQTVPQSLPPNTSFLQPYHLMKMYPPTPPTVLQPHERDLPFHTTSEATQSAKDKVQISMPEYAAECSRARQSVRADPRGTSDRKELGDDVVVTTLGTGSAMPSKYRNVSSTHLDIPGLGGVLLDVGEGTLGQLRRRFGHVGLSHVYENLRMIFISHMHADHHLGLHFVLEDRYRVSNEHLESIDDDLRGASPVICTLSLPFPSRLVSKSRQHGNIPHQTKLSTRLFGSITITCSTV